MGVVYFVNKSSVYDLFIAGFMYTATGGQSNLPKAALNELHAQDSVDM